MNPEGTSPIGGIICLWSGAIVDIPDGWYLCDGNNGTPDLRQKFVLGAGDIYDPDDTGGDSQHTHVLTMDSHYHWLKSGSVVSNDSPDGDYQPTVSTKVTTGTNDQSPHIPPFYALAYIMKG